MLNRRSLTIFSGLAAFAVGFVPAARAETADDASVAKAVEAYRTALAGSDAAKLEAICSNKLSYGHSSGKIEDKTTFVTNAAKSKWNGVNLSDQSNQVVGNNAISRFILTGETVSDGKPNPVKIGVLIVWDKEPAGWKMLARQAFKI